jgi:hypothetical protein
MKKIIIATIFASTLVSPMAMAEGAYGGLSYGQVAIDDVDMGNLGIVLGNTTESGFGYELLYSFTIIEEEETDNGVEIKAGTDIVGLYATYQTPGDLYLKAQLGYGFVRLKFDALDAGSTSDTVDGFAYGLGGGVNIGRGSVELAYYRFADLEKFDGIDVDDEKVEMLNLTYLFSF